jgi:dethiobiotin synthetase
LSRGFFVTGTDTDIGKTVVAASVVRLLRARGIRVGGFKPVAAGAVHEGTELRNDDALTLMAAGEPGLDYADVNPVCLAPAIAPHIAAEEAGQTIQMRDLLAAFARLQQSVDVVIAEGAGGWLVPLGDDFDIAGLARELDLPVLMVVGLRLGCINHARLTERAILDSGVALAGWIGSRVDPGFARCEENVGTLRRLLHSPCLGILPYLADDTPTCPEALEADQLLAALG